MLFPRGDVGASLTEYLALVVLAGVVGAVVLNTVIPGRVQGNVERAVCLIFVREGCDSVAPGQRADQQDGQQNGNGQQQADVNHTDVPCTRSRSNEKVGAEVQVASLTLGKEYTYVKKTLADGRVKVMFVDESQVGATGGPPGWNMPENKVAEGEASLEGSIEGHFSAGNGYYFDGEEEFQKFKGDLEKSFVRDQVRNVGGWRADLAYAVGDATGITEPPDPPDPDIRSASMGAEAAAKLEGELLVGEDTEKHGTVGMNMEAEAEVKFDESVTVSERRDDPDNTRYAFTRTYSAEASGKAAKGGRALGYGWDAEAGAEYSWDGAVRIMRNEDGTLHSIRYITKTEKLGKAGASGTTPRGNGNGAGGDGTAVTQGVEVTFDTPQERATGERLLRQRGPAPPRNLLRLMDQQLHQTTNAGNGTVPPPDADAPAWQQLVYDKGKVWQSQSDLDHAEGGFDADVKWGLQFGFDFDWENTSASTRQARVLGEPGDGERAFREFPSCVEEGDA
ncbi:hypothetical protein FHX37_2804 [Haloactinospora alba]|uniref:Uncharacterized protein n=1 Tax=Haloactinospora alba TaxID=405555 RepID=A0A543NLX5_9ACTN|nr:hypothetical protein [Haloactinospora alba]TQN32820.1 hypothetical protein FHX37_2804 [Haloactinospora alba]